MVNVPTNKILSDPLKIARHYYVLEPLLEDIVFYHARSKMEEELEIARGFAMNKRIVGALEYYHLYHKKIKEEIPEIFSKEVIFINGFVKVGNKRYGIDASSSLNKLTDKLLEDDIFRDLEGIIFFPVAPIIAPFFVDDGKIKYFFEDKLKEVDEIMKFKKKRELNFYEKNKDNILARGFYQFNETLYNSMLAKKILECPQELSQDEFEKIIEIKTSFNRQLLVNVFANFLKYLHGKVYIYAIKTSISYKIMEKACKLAEREISFQSKNLTKNIQDLSEAELNETMLKRLKRIVKRIKNEHMLEI